MMPRSSDLARLLLLTEAIYAADRSKMMELNQLEENIRNKIQELKLSHLNSDVTSEVHFISNNEVNYSWLNWADKCAHSLNEDLIKIMVEKSRLQKKLAHSFGHQQVIQSISEQNRASIKKKRDANDIIKN